jgi:glycerol-3-phosphate dehydrogenase (NAD(P)+)
MGTALAQVAASNGHQVRAWSIEPDVLEEIAAQQRNTKYLSGVELSPNISACPDLESAVRGAGLVIVSVPSKVVPDLARRIAPLIEPDQVVLNVAKGLEPRTHKRMSEVLVEALGSEARPRVASMGGPAIASELSTGMPTAVIVGIAGAASGALCQQALQNDYFKLEVTSDLVGVELCSTLKNVYAIALGMCDGLRYGSNTKAFLATLALREKAVISGALGGRQDTVYGLAGQGDLLTTGFNERSRNRTFGEMLARGGDWRRFLETHTVEGVEACRAITELTEALRLDLPLLEVVRRALFEGTPADAVMTGFFRSFRFQAGRSKG